jgi:pimeloyl-ACP methyl ester carboxylesterase/DNA-binding CsgD family transcriptional regulator
MSQAAGTGRIRQQVRYVRAADGTRMAWADSGAGPVIVKAANWLTHLEYELDSPIWAHWLRFFVGHSRFVRYDERGCGMSEWQGGPISIEHWVTDLETVIDAANPEGPVTLLGISQGAATCIEYAIRHPERVSGLILHGGYAVGALRRDAAAAMKHRAMVDLARVAWGSDNPTFRQVFTSRFIPGGTARQLEWFNDLCLKVASPEVAASLLEARGDIDVTDSLSRVGARTLVLHSHGDEVVPVSEGRRLASGIRDAEFVELDSRNHVLLEDEPAWQRFCEAVLAFLKPGEAGPLAAFAALSDRERQVLSLMSEGLSNAAIAGRLQISEKTVRNHASNIFDKLGVWSRAQAIVFARDHEFRG